MMQLNQFLQDVQDNSNRLYGPSRSSAGVVADASEALRHAGRNPQSVQSWVKVIMAAMEGACRCGSTAFTVGQAMQNELAALAAGRTRPDVSQHLAPVAPRYSQRERDSMPIDVHQDEIPTIKTGTHRSHP